MFDFLKKKVNSFQVAAYIATEPSRHVNGIENAVDEFLGKNPQYQDLRNKLLDEIQWIIVACGVIAIRILTDVKTAKEVKKQVSAVFQRIHDTNDKKTMFTPEFLKRLDYQIDAYLVRFNRGLILRDEEKSSPAVLFNEAMKDFANETMEYITGESRATEMAGWEDIDKLQERTEEEDELERFAYRTIRQFIPQFQQHFRQFRIETVG